MAPNCVNFCKDVFVVSSWVNTTDKLYLIQLDVTLRTLIFSKFLSASSENKTILYLDNTSTLDLYLDLKHSWEVLNTKYKERYILYKYFSETSSRNVYVIHYIRHISISWIFTTLKMPTLRFKWKSNKRLLESIPDFFENTWKLPTQVHFFPQALSFHPLFYPGLPPHWNFSQTKSVSS